MNQWDIEINGAKVGHRYKSRVEAATALTFALFSFGFKPETGANFLKIHASGCVCINGMSYRVVELKQEGGL